MENKKKRHGCVFAWLTLMLLANSFSASLYFFSDTFKMVFEEVGHPKSFIVILGILSIGNILFSVMLFKWSKIGFYGFIVTSVLAFGINFFLQIPIFQNFVGLLSIAILYGILHIKKDGITSWEQLE